MSSIQTAPMSSTNVNRSSSPQNDRLESMRAIRTTLRPDLQITRTTNRGDAIYIIFDPVSFRSHRLTLDDYEVVSRLSTERSLGECFDACTRAGLLKGDDESQFYHFINQLSSLGLLLAQSPAPKLLYERFTQAQKATNRSKYLGFLFLTLPLSNPDKFLDRTIGRFRLLFTTPFVAAWLIGLLFSLAIVVSRWDSFWEPLNGVLAGKNLLFLGLAFIGLKVWHELGHGYACKLFGGRVPEMGCKLIVGMPLAYVDASSAWSFPRRRDRLIVMLGGMYFEWLLAVPAIILWAYWPHSAIGSFAYQIVFMAGIATLVFNINPLMKFDGYFILSDLLGISNLRTKAVQEVKHQLKIHALGLPVSRPQSIDQREQTILIAYGISSIVYGWILMISIAGLIATRFHLIGLIIAGVQLGYAIFQNAHHLYRYLWFDEELAAVRLRAKKVGWGLAIGLPLLIVLCPVPMAQYVSGVVTASKATQLRVATPGFIEAILDPAPETVTPGLPLVWLRNIDIETNLSAARLNETAAVRSMHLMRQGTPADEARQLQTAITAVANRAVAEKTQYELTLNAPHEGRLASLLPQQRIGTYLQTGEVVAIIAQGSTQVRAWLNEEQLATSRLEVGGKVSIRIANDRSQTHVGTIRSVAPANQSKFEDITLTTIGEGSIPYDPQTGETLEQVFQLLVDVPELDSLETSQGLTASVRISRRYESLGVWTVRQTTKFINALFANAN